jgi:hypothetical protein
MNMFERLKRRFDSAAVGKTAAEAAGVMYDNRLDIISANLTEVRPQTDSAVDQESYARVAKLVSELHQRMATRDPHSKYATIATMPFSGNKNPELFEATLSKVKRLLSMAEQPEGSDFLQILAQSSHTEEIKAAAITELNRENLYEHLLAGAPDVQAVWPDNSIDYISRTGIPGTLLLVSLSGISTMSEAKPVPIPTGIAVVLSH